MKQIILFACIGILFGCTNLKKEHVNPSDKRKEYCIQVYRDAGFKDKIPRESLANCLLVTENREKISKDLDWIEIKLTLIHVAISSLTLFLIGSQ